MYTITVTTIKDGVATPRVQYTLKTYEAAFSAYLAHIADQTASVILDGNGSRFTRIVA